MKDLRDLKDFRPVAVLRHGNEGDVCVGIGSQPVHPISEVDRPVLAAPAVERGGNNLDGCKDFRLEIRASHGRDRTLTGLFFFFARQRLRFRSFGLQGLWV